jgi:hypothetical protein
VQESLLILAGKWERIRSREAYLCGTLAHRCVIYWRKRRRRELVHSYDREVLELYAGAPDPDQWRVDTRLDALRLLKGLKNRRQAAVLWFRLALGWSSREIASALGYQLASIRKETARGLAGLRELCLSVPLNSPAPESKPFAEMSLAELLAVGGGRVTCESSKAAYRRGMAELAAHLGVSDPVAAFSALLAAGRTGAQAEMARFGAALLERGLAPATIKLRLTSVRSAVRLARLAGIIEWDLRIPLRPAASPREAQSQASADVPMNRK